MRKLFIVTICGMALYSLFAASPQAMGQDTEFLIAELGGVQMVTIPQPSPGPGLIATKFVLRTASENKLVTYENLAITGNPHQVWLPGAFGGPPGPTPFVDSPGWGQLPPEWIAADSHILITPSMVAGGAGGSHGGIAELNDLGNHVGADEILPLLGGQALAVTGAGDIAMAANTDAFFVAPEFQTNEIELAYVVGCAQGGTEPISVTVGVLGAGIIDSGQPGGASFGFNGNPEIGLGFLAGGVCIPEPTTAFLAGMACLALLSVRRHGND